MIHTPKIFNTSIPLYACVLSLSVLGYLGYRIVRWIKDKCYRTNTVNQTVQKNIENLSSTHSSHSLINRVSDLEMSPDKVTMGQGEYIVFHKLPTGEKLPLTSETFERVYKVLLEHSPIALANSEAERVHAHCANRHELLKAKLKEIDPTLEAVFIPRTLYELIFIRKCIQEDLRHKNICPFLKPSSHDMTLDDFDGDQQRYERYLKNKQARQKEKKCWHLCYFTDAGDNACIGVKNVAYRLNKAMFKAFAPSSEGFTYPELLTFAEKEITFLKGHYNKGLETMQKLHSGEKVEEISSSSTPGPTTNFGFEITRGSVKPMGIRDETDAQIIRDAITLDCSKIAQHSLFLFRGADFQKDSTACWNDKDTSYSLSFGSSLFAGCLYDGGATAFYYMRNGQNAYAMPVPFDQLNNSPFYVPTTHPVVQLFGDGEIFHARTKAWKDFDLKKIGGMNSGENGHMREHLRSDLSKEELNAQFEAYKNKAFQLK